MPNREQHALMNPVILRKCIGVAAVWSMALCSVFPFAASAQTTTTELTIRAGDILALAYVFDIPDPALPYLIEPGDEISLFFPYSPEVLSFEEYIVAPDGKVAFRGSDERTQVANRTPDEVIADLKKAYAPVFSDPKLNLNVKQSFAKNMVLQRLFQAEKAEHDKEHRQSFMRLPVPGDLLLNLPLLTRVPAAGRSVAELGTDLTARYRALGFKYLTVSVWFEQLGARSVSVLGQVRTPGSVSVGEGSRLWDAVAKAGGPTFESDPVRALIIDQESTPSRRLFSLSDYLKTADPAQNPLLRGGELISVGGNL